MLCVVCSMSVAWRVMLVDCWLCGVCCVLFACCCVLIVACVVHRCCCWFGGVCCVLSDVRWLMWAVCCLWFVVS